MVRSLNRALLIVVFASVHVGCKSGSKHSADPEVNESDMPADDGTITISVIGTNDVHGHMDRLAVFGGYMNNLRAAREQGGVVLLDGGDMFQGTLESNPNEGAQVVRAFNALGYTAAAIGNHEFDFGPVGPKAIPETAEDDPQGALRARARESRFPLLAANLINKDGGPLEWDNVTPSILVSVAGVKVGIIGVSTAETLRTTIANNVVNLGVIDPAAAIEREATKLRSQGATTVLVTAHAGGRCKDFHNPHELTSCQDGEIFSVARRLPSGLVDVIVAGHTHAGVAHRVNGIAIIESFANGKAFGRADLIIRDGVLKKTHIFPPREICGSQEASCDPGNYEGKPVTEDRAVAAIVTEAQTAAAEERSRPLGVQVETKVSRNYRYESALGNLFTDLMLASRPLADVAITNAGGLRADLAKGTLTYGALFEAMPFDNRYAVVKLSAEQLARLFEINLQSSGGILSVAGAEVHASCAGGKPRVSIHRDGKRLARTDMLTLLTSDFLAGGGDGAMASLGLPDGAITFEQKETIRDAMAAVLDKRTRPLRGDELLIKDKPRLVYPGKRPICK